MGCCLSIALSRPSERLVLVLRFLKGVLLRVGGGMGRHLLIALSRHSEREVLVDCLGVLLMCCH